MENCRSYPHSLSLSDSNRFSLLLDCQKAFTSRAVERGDQYSQGATFFLSASQTPRCTLERLAKQIFSYHTRDLTYNSLKSGAEWWVLYVHHIDEIGFHWDRDYGAEIDDNQMIHPKLGTVTYLSDIGGPTIALDVCGDLPTQQFDGCPINSGRISYPSFGKHITFDGLLLHGAPTSIFTNNESSSEGSSSDESEESESETIPIPEARVTFLVNIWIDHIPNQADNPPDDLLSQLSNIQDINMEFHETTPTVLNIEEEEKTAAALQQSHWKLSSHDKVYDIVIPLPVESKISPLLETEKGITIKWNFPLKGTLKYLGEEESTDEEDEENDEDEDDQDEKSEAEEDQEEDRRKRHHEQDEKEKKKRRVESK